MQIAGAPRLAAAPFSPPSICTIATGKNAAAAQGLRGRKNRVDTICIFLMVIRYFQSIILSQNFLASDRRRKRSRSSGKTFSNVWSNDPEGLGKRSRTFNQTIEKVFREEREPSAKSSCIKKRNHSIICKKAFFQNVQLSGFANGGSGFRDIINGTGFQLAAEDIFCHMNRQDARSS